MDVSPLTLDTSGGPTITPFTLYLGATFLIAELLCLAMLTLGHRLAGHRQLRPVAQALHRQKMRALERWPLTRVRRAVESGDQLTATSILSLLILLKSAAVLLLGVVMLFWLPLAALLLPTLVAAHDSEDRQLQRWASRLAALQITSHVLAATVGFVLTVRGPLAGAPLSHLTSNHALPVAVVLLGSVVFAVAAGRREALGLLHHGVLEDVEGRGR